MTKQVNTRELERSLTRTKQYIDSQSNAQVVKTETVLWNDIYNFPASQNTPISHTTDPYGVTYWSFWGATTGDHITLSDDVTNYDELHFYTWCGDTPINDASGGIVGDFRITVKDVLYVNSVYPTSFYEWYDADTGNNRQSFMAIIGLVTKNKLGFYADYRPSEYNSLGIYKIAGVKYSAKEEYSTTEQVIGTWIDGRPLYQKTISFGALPTNNRKNVAHGIADIDLVTEITATSNSTTGEAISIPTYSSTAYYADIYTNQAKTDIVIATGTADRSTFTKTYVTLKYVKTTD